MAGKSILHYEIVESIGKGGMGEVFRAKDTKLGRDVAIKVLPAELMGDPEREARFQREARVLASLQHANIASVYGFEEVGGDHYLVMELVEGLDLTHRLVKGPIPPSEVLEIARQIASGLEAAHESGIVHRDLKPANIMLSSSGEVKILDFGLAQAWFGDDPTKQDSSASPTITAAMTQVGTILGTAAYMSPEQARGTNVDRRADIWAFGVILFEMLTGKQLFQGETISDTLAAVLRADPDWDALPVEEAPELCRLIERCLERNPKQRLRDIGEARIFLQEGGQSTSHLSFSQLSMPAAQEAPAAKKFPLVPVLGIALAALLLGAGMGWKVLARPEPMQVLHTMVPPPKGAEFDLADSNPGPVVISPDGTMLAFSAFNDEGAEMLYLRHLNKGESVTLSGTDGAAYPFWSPDSRFIAFFDIDENKLKKVAVGGGPPVTLCPASNGKGGSWNQHGQIIFAPSHNTPISLVPDIGGEPISVTKIGEGYNSNRHPRFLPDGKQFLYVARTAVENEPNDICLASIDTTVVPRVIAESQTNGDYVNGQLLTVREDVLMATPFSLNQDRATGGVPLVEDILSLPGAAVSVFSGGGKSMLAFQTGGSNRTGMLVMWTTTASGSVERLGEPGQVFHPIISPDGSQAAVEVREETGEGIDLWLIDLGTGLRTRFTFAPGDETSPCWSPDGGILYYQSLLDGRAKLMQQPVEGQGGAAVLMESEKDDLYPNSVNPNGLDLLIDVEREDGVSEVHRFLLESGETELVVSAEKGDVVGGMYSPDGRWIAYNHDAPSGGWNVYVMPAQPGPRKWQVTTDNYVYPVWKSNSELWTVSFSGELFEYVVDGSGSTFRVGPSQRLLQIRPPDGTGRYYDIHPDGKRILQTGPDPALTSEAAYIQLITDWERGLGQ